MLEPIFATIKTYLIVVDTLVVIVRVAKKHRDYIINVVILLLAFFVGKLLSRKNQSEMYFQQFNNSTKDKIELAAKIANQKRILLIIDLFAGIGLLGYVLVFTYSNRDIFEFGLNELETIQNVVLNNPRNFYLMWSFWISLLIYYVLKKYFGFRIGNLTHRIDGIGINQTTYVERFLSIIGPEITSEVKKYFLKGWQTPIPNDREIALEIQTNKLKIAEIFDKITGEEKTGRIMRAGITQMKEFEWCDTCRADKTGMNSNHGMSFVSYSINQNNCVEFPVLADFCRDLKNKTLKTGKNLKSKFFWSPIFDSVKDDWVQKSETRSFPQKDNESKKIRQMRVCKNQCLIFYVKHILVIFSK